MDSDDLVLAMLLEGNNLTYFVENQTYVRLWSYEKNIPKFEPKVNPYTYLKYSVNLFSHLFSMLSFRFPPSLI